VAGGGRIDGGLPPCRRGFLIATPTETTHFLAYRPPFDWQAILAFLATRAIVGVERVDGETYQRTMRADGAFGRVAIRDDPARSALEVSVVCLGPDVIDAALVRAAFICDLSADLPAIAAHLSRDALLAPLISRRPGLRVPGGWDVFEIGVRAILGQQVTVVSARGLAGTLVRLCGVPLPADLTAPGLTHSFPQAADVAAADLGPLGMPGARRATLSAWAAAAASSPELFRRGDPLDIALARLRAVRGIGDWTAHYIALRGLRDPDAFPSSDIGLLRATADATGSRLSPAALVRRAESWRPFRAYAAQHLWTADAAAPWPGAATRQFGRRAVRC
jgi:AraC family transcriptional regulator of adaptative response / DNA-3-methyladenine glycosylase II